MTSRVVLALACIPVTALAVVGAWGVVANTAGGWVWPPDDVNVSEAVATGNYAELVRLLEDGADPTRSSSVRAPLLASQTVVVTPLEAAVLVRNATMMANIPGAYPGMPGSFPPEPGSASAATTR